MMRRTDWFMLQASVLSLLLAGCGWLRGNDPDEPPPPPVSDVSTLDGTQFAQISGDAVAGERAYSRCQPCHSTEAGVTSIGPSLHNIVGSPAATTAPDFNYSRALRNSGIIWTPAKLNQFIEQPRRVVPRSRMTFAGVRKAQDRADIIAYLATLK